MLKHIRVALGYTLQIFECFVPMTTPEFSILVANPFCKAKVYHSKQLA